jgi:hypothetical protein
MISRKTAAHYSGIMRRQQKKPRTFSGGAFVQMMRPNFYARTTPKARGGCLVFVVVLKVVIIGAGP